MKKKIALITGVTGQDGSYLAEFLLKKDYIVYGLKRRSSSFNTQRIDHLYKDYQEKNNFIPIYGDLTDSTNILRVIKNTQPDEIDGETHEHQPKMQRDEFGVRPLPVHHARHDEVDGPEHDHREKPIEPQMGMGHRVMGKVCDRVDRTQRFQ